MNKKIHKIFGIGLAFVLAVSLGIGMVAPVAAADYEENDWGTWGLPDTDLDTDIGPIAIAPDGTLYAAVFFYNEDTDPYYFWKVCMSEDDGYTWDDTDIDDLPSCDDAETNCIVSIVVSPNYADDETVYVGIYEDDDGDPLVWRLEDAGDDSTALKPLMDSDGDEADVLYCIDVFTDEDDYNWILAGTNEDVLVLKDRVFEDWRDQELEAPGYEVAFAPDFEESELIWAVTEDWFDNDGDTGWDFGEDCFLLTSTESPGNWGQELDEALIMDTDDYGVFANPFLDIGFPGNYDSNPDSGDTYVILGVCNLGYGWGDSGVYLIEGVEGDGDRNTWDSVSIELSDGDDPDNQDITSIAVSGDFGDDMVILAGDLWYPIVYISDDGDGEDWDEADKNPTGSDGTDYTDWFESWTHVVMEADATWGGATFDTEEGMAFATTFGYESAVSRSDDGGWVYNQIGLIDTTIDGIWDLALHPEFPDETVLILGTWSDDYSTDSLWLTENGDEDAPDYVRILCGYDGDLGNFECDELWLVEYAQDASAIFISGEDDGDDPAIWMSDDDGQTFGDHRKVKDGTNYGWINDWVITDDDTIFAAVNDDDDNGFFKTINGGLSWTEADAGDDMYSIAVSPDFDAEDEEGYILLGGMDGEVALSDDIGDTFDDAEAEEDADLFGYVSVAFDADFADEDADGYMMIYAADDEGSDIRKGEVADTDDVDWADLEDDQNEDTQAIFCTGLVVAEDNALYAIGITEEMEVEVTVVDGSIEITDDNTSAIGDVDIDDLELTILDGDFEDTDEIYDVLDQELTVDVFGIETTVSGYIWVEGETSGDEGRFELDEVTVDVTSGDFEDGMTATVTSYSDGDLVVDVTIEDAAAAVVRLLLHETNSEWESAADSDLENPGPLELSYGSNVLWTIDWEDGQLWVLEDTLSGSPTLDAPPDGYASDNEEEMRVSWDEMRGIDEDYHVKYTNVEPDVTESVYTDGTSILLTQLSDTSEYTWKVRAAPQSRDDDNASHDTWSSRWSGKWTFSTALGAPNWAPTLYTPGGVWQYSGIDVDLMPAFSWESAKTADSYQFMLADNAEFASPLVNEKVSSSAYQLDFELELNSNYFWKVQAYKGTKALSRWSDVGAFTTIGPAPAPPPSPAPPATVTQPAPAPIVLPTIIPPAVLWTIVGIGAILIIAVVVLIVRTRRAV